MALIREFFIFAKYIPFKWAHRYY